MVVGGEGVGNENGGDGGGAEFGEAAGTRAGHGDGGHGVGQFHVLAERGHMADERRVFLVFRGDEVEVLGSGDVEDLEPVGCFGEGGQGRDDCLIDSAGTLAAAHDEDGRAAWFETEEGGGFGGVGWLGEGRAEWCSGHERPGFREVGGAGCKADEDGVAEAGREAIGLAGDGIGFVNEGAESEFASCHGWGEGRESAHAEDGIRLEAAEQLEALPAGFPEAPEEPGHGRRERAGHGDGREFFEAEVVMALGGEGIDLLA